MGAYCDIMQHLLSTYLCQSSINYSTYMTSFTNVLTFMELTVLKVFLFYFVRQDFSGGAEDKNLPANAGVKGSISGRRRFHMTWSM